MLLKILCQNPLFFYLFLWDVLFDLSNLVSCFVDRQSICLFCLLICVCKTVCVCDCRTVCLPVCLSFMSIFLTICLYVCLSAFVFMSVCYSVYWQISFCQMLRKFISTASIAIQKRKSEAHTLWKNPTKTIRKIITNLCNWIKIQSIKLCTFSITIENHT